jgi:hypothetical protein
MDGAVTHPDDVAMETDNVAPLGLPAKKVPHKSRAVLKKNQQRTIAMESAAAHDDADINDVATANDGMATDNDGVATDNNGAALLETTPVAGTLKPRPQRQAAKANQHPGRAHQAYNQTRRTPAEKKADEDQKAARKLAKDVAYKEKVARIAQLELELEQEQKTDAEATPKPIAKRQLRRTETYINIDDEASEWGGRGEDGDGDFTMPASEAAATTDVEELPPKKKSKTTKEGKGKAVEVEEVVADSRKRKDPKGTIRNAVEKKKEEMKSSDQPHGDTM